MKMLCLFLALFVFTILSASCDEIYQTHIKALENNEEYFYRNITTWGAVSSTFAVPGVLSAAAGIPGSPLMIAFSIPALGRSGLATTGLIPTRRELLEVEKTFHVIQDAANGGGIDISNLVAEINAESSSIEVKLDDVVTLIDKGNDRNDFCRNNTIATYAGLKNYVVTNLSSQQ